MQIIRKASFTATPWKNGGGVTHEALRVPATGDTFRWRVSIAQIDRSGPFSDFAGYNRKMVLLRGAGVRLTFDGARQSELREVGDLAEFDGAAKAECELVDGPCTDLNLIVTKSMGQVRAWVETLRERRSLDTRHGGVTLLVGIGGPLSIDAGGGFTTRLDPWDLAVLAPPDAAVVRAAELDGSTAPLAFFAALDDNPP